MDINVKIKKDKRAEPVERKFPIGTSYEKIVKEYQSELPYRILAVRVDNQVRQLNRTLEKECTIELLDMRTNSANLIYQRSMEFIYLKAIYDVLGKDARVSINNSLNKGLYTMVKWKTPMTDELVKSIEARMKELVKADIPIQKEVVAKEKAFEFLKEDNHKEKIRILESATDVDNIAFYSLEGYRDYFYGQMVPSTGYVEYFELRRYRNGVLVRFPHNSKPDEIPPYVDEKKLYGAFSEATEWERLMRISYVEDLNERVENDDDFLEMIQLSEALHEKKIASFADQIVKEKRSVILIAGPSSSGKTTFARRLCILLKVNGLDPLYMGTDDYFVERDETPKDEFGEYDYENIEALDIKLFNKDMNALLRGETVDLPTFDFMDGKKKYGRRITKGRVGQPIVIEGIHGLNKELTMDIDDEKKFKIYISPLTQLSIDDHNRIPTTDLRMIRRMIRDHQFRGNDARKTISTWPKVRAGEDKNIFPFSGEADVFFNSSHIYELSVLKKYAEPLLREISADEAEYSEAVRLLKFLQFFKAAKDDSAIVNNSILREFIGGSIFV